MRLLLAEDEKELSKALTAILKHNGYSVDAVYNGKDALDYLLGGDYDCVILDIMMPLLDGISVLKGIRHEGLTCRLSCLRQKVKLTTGFSDSTAELTIMLQSRLSQKNLLHESELLYAENPKPIKT